MVLWYCGIMVLWYHGIVFLCFLTEQPGAGSTSGVTEQSLLVMRLLGHGEVSEGQQSIQ